MARSGPLHVAGSARPLGTAVAVDGGYRASGHWNYASGVRHANWFLGTCFVDRPDGRTASKSMLIPVTDGTIVATNTGDDSTQSAVWEISGVLQVTNPAGTPIAAIVGNPTKDVRHTDNAVLECDIAADGTNGLKITVYGDPTAGKYCVWTAMIQLVVAAGDSSNP